MGALEWTPDNEDERVVHTSPKVESSREKRLGRPTLKRRSHSPYCMVTKDVYT